jgi:zinc protease
VVVLWLSFAGLAESKEATAFPPPFEEHRLSNGLRVILAPDDTLSDVSIVVRYEAGRGDDPDGKEGLAHVTEHVLFGAFRQGAHARLLLQAGASNVNAHTDFDFTSFEETVPPEALDLALWLEGARMATAANAVDENLVARERAIAGNEYRQFGYRVFPPFGPFFEFEWNELYPEWHPYHLPQDALGALSGIRAPDVRAFAATWYGPNNASIVLAGRFEAERALGLVQKSFGSIPARPPPLRPELPTLPEPGNLWLDVEAPVTHPVALMAWRGPEDHTQEERELLIAARLLSAPHGTVDRMFVEGDGDALRITFRELPARAGSAFVAVVEPREGITLAKLLPALQAEMAAFPDQITDVDVARIKKTFSDEQRADLETSFGRAVRLADPTDGPSWRLNDYDAVDRASLVDTMRVLLTSKERVTLVVRPATRPLYGAIGVLLHRDRMSP